MHWKDVSIVSWRSTKACDHTASQKMNVLRDLCGYMKLFQTLWRKFRCTFITALPLFTNSNTFLQTEEPLIQCLYDQIQRFMNKLASKFIKPEVIQQLKWEGLSFSKLNISLENQKSNPDLTIGILNKTLLAKLLDDGNILETSSDCFYDSVRAFYETKCECYVTWLPADDTLYKKCWVFFLTFLKEILFNFNAWQKFLLFFQISLTVI